MLKQLCVHAYVCVLMLLLRPGREAEYCEQLVCLCVCLFVREHISGTTGPICANFFVQIACGHGSVLLGWHCDTLCTSSFTDDITFGRNWLYGDAWKAEPLTYCH